MPFPIANPDAIGGAEDDIAVPARRPWDDRVESWDAVARSPEFRRLAEAVCRVADPRRTDRIVDLGAGTGLLSLAFAPLAAAVVAIDSSRPMLERLEELACGAGMTNVQTVVSDMRSLPLDDESATLVVSNYAFHHLDDAGKELALAEARRILVPGGRLVVCDMMFSVSFGARDRQLIASKVYLMARRGPAGVVRIGKNAARFLTGRWEHPSPAHRWEAMLAARRFEGISVRTLAHEGGIAEARRPSLPRSM